MKKILDPESPLHFLPKGIQSNQLMICDSLRFSLEMADYSFEELIFHIENVENMTEQFRMRGLARFHNKEFENSILDYNRALKLDPSLHYVLKSRAFSLLFLRRMDEAILDLKKAVEIKPTGDYYDNLSEFYELKGDSENAFYYHEKAIEQSPIEARLWYNYAVYLVKYGRNEEALEKYDKAISLWPMYPDAISNREILIESMKNK
ncbi:MAG: hypothetical protein HRT71_09505 [Flavobacteriales bacterium]|nr:hypothetical protein [Flavobacteriales bacterium]